MPLAKSPSSLPWAAVASALLLAPDIAYAVGDSGTRFNLYVPPNNVLSSRRTLLIVTNVSPSDATVDIIDDGADGDDDDTVTGLVLGRGQSHVIRMADGAVNDDVGGAHDGDYFKVRSDHPVVVQMATQSNWQHDWAPAEGGGSIGRSFFVYAPATSGADNDINVYAYQDDTQVTVRDVTVSPALTGTTSVALDNGAPTLQVTLEQGEDLIVRENGLGLDILDPGHTYWIQASAPVTVQYGHLGQVNGGNQARDGAGFVPSINGSSSGSLYYFAIPHNPGLAREKELRVTCSDLSTVSLFGATSEGTDWLQITSTTVAAGGSLDFVGQADAAFRNTDLYRLEVDPPYNRCTVFEGNWMETGFYGTSDFASAVSSTGGTNIGHQFIAYIGPPGIQNAVQPPAGEATNIPATPDGYGSHLYVYARDADTNVTITDLATGGEILSHSFDVEADGYYDFVIDRATFDTLRADGRRPYLRIDAAEPVMVMNGNFNDNWMAFFHSVMAPSVRATVQANSETLACGESTTIVATCEVDGDAGSNLVATVTTADGMELSSGLPTVEFTRTGPATTEVFEVDIEATCSEGVIAPLRAVTVECAVLDGAEPVASVATINIDVDDPDLAEARGLLVEDRPDYEGTPPDPRVEVQFRIEGGVGTAEVRVLRAVGNADADAPQTELYVDTPAPGGVIEFDDPYPLHYEETRFYRVVVDNDGVEQTFGPVAVRTSSGGSGGGDAGLESNGRLSSALARRRVARSQRAGWLLPATREALETRVETRDATLLSTLFPLAGPRDSVPVDVTPADLIVLTNADSVAAVDYVDDQGIRSASALVVETRGEVYEHSKVLCDRAGGSRIDALGSEAWPDGDLLRVAFANDRDRTGEYATELKLYEQTSGSFELYSQWLGDHYPPVAPDQRVLNLQVWSPVPGFDLAVLSDILAPLDVSWPAAPEPPQGYFVEAATLGSKIAGRVRGAPDGLRLRATTLHDDGELHTMDLGPADGTLDVDLDPFIDVTLELVEPSGRIADRVWLSDGAWTVLDDSMWGGQTELTSFEAEHCIEHPNQPGLQLSGCGRLDAVVDEFAGVARHIGGGLAPLRPSPDDHLEFTWSSNQPVRVCLEDANKPGEAQPCVQLAASSDVQRTAIALREFSKLDTCEALDVDAIDLVTFTGVEPGPLHLEVHAVSFAALPSSTSQSADAGCVPPPTAQDDAPQAGCGCASRGESPTGLPWLLVLLGAWRFKRRRTC